ncbi:hypothetical protein [Magnetococcus marinus]|uniref:hypothetical protein n=1 Tax=Magnetococcus marinus TaxID=1124597 RepID=UPI00003C551C|nr:hypothetical protein [Magnetococcus marinus]
MSIYGLSSYMAKAATQGMTGPKKDSRDDTSRGPAPHAAGRTSTPLKERNSVAPMRNRAYQVTISAAAMNRVAAGA